jgi:hypothetical protein
MVNRVADFFLTSSEGYGLESPRACMCRSRLGGRKGDDYLLVEIDPPLIGQRFGRGAEDIHVLVLATRHEGQSLFPVSEWPLYVHVALARRDLAGAANVAEGDLQLIGWGEIYRTEEDAAAAVGP